MHTRSSIATHTENNPIAELTKNWQLVSLWSAWWEFRDNEFDSYCSCVQVGVGVRRDSEWHETAKVEMVIPRRAGALCLDFTALDSWPRSLRFVYKVILLNFSPRRQITTYSLCFLGRSHRDWLRMPRGCQDAQITCGQRFVTDGEY